MSNEEFKKKYVELVLKINTEKDKDKREELCDSLKDMVYSFADGCDHIYYKDGILSDDYINFDSNCGLTIVSATDSVSAIVQYVCDNNIDADNFTMSEAADILSSELDTRDEYWEDVISGLDSDDEEFYVYEGETDEKTLNEQADAIITIAEAKEEGEEEFLKDLRDQLEKLEDGLDNIN